MDMTPARFHRRGGRCGWRRRGPRAGTFARTSGGSVRSGAARQGARIAAGRKRPGGSGRAGCAGRHLRAQDRSAQRRARGGAGLGGSGLQAAAADAMPTAAIAELGYGGMQGEHMVVVENTPTVHNLIVCTLCSCYPWPVLGLPPVWYKSAPYRSRVGDRSARRAARVRAATCRTTSRCAFGTAPRNCATWSCRSVRAAPRS